jgi:hypothetical protein
MGYLGLKTLGLMGYLALASRLAGPGDCFAQGSAPADSSGGFPGLLNRIYSTVKPEQPSTGIDTYFADFKGGKVIIDDRYMDKKLELGPDDIAINFDSSGADIPKRFLRAGGTLDFGIDPEGRIKVWEYTGENPHYDDFTNVQNGDTLPNGMVVFLPKRYSDGMWIRELPDEQAKALADTIGGRM